MELAQTLCAGSTGIKQQLETQILVYGVNLLVLQEIWPSGEAGSAVTMGDYVRDVFLEQVRPCNLADKSCLLIALLSTLL